MARVTRVPEAWRNLARLWLLLGALGGLGLAGSAPPGQRAAMERVLGETDYLAQIKGLTDLLRQAWRPRVNTLDALPTATYAQAPYGVNAFLHHEVGQNRRRQVIALAAQAGFAYLRQPMPWEDVEIHARGDFEDRRNEPPRSAWYKYDNVVDLARAQGLQVIFRLDDPPAWAQLDGGALGSQAPPREIQDYAAFAARVAAHFQGRVRYYQIWNEPNIYPEWGRQPVSPEAYAELLQAAATAIRAADPEAVIVLAAMAATTAYDGHAYAGGNLNDLVFLQRVYAAGGAPYFDVAAVQGYGLWSGPTDRRMHPLAVNFSRVRFVRDLMVQHGDGGKPIWIAEMNWNAVPEGQAAPFGRVTLEEQARYLPWALERLREWPWVELANVWYLKRAQPDWEERGDPQAHFRLMTYDGRLMPAYRALQAYLTGQPDAGAPGRRRAP